MGSRSTATNKRREPASPTLAACRLSLLALLFLACVGPHLAARLVAGRSSWPRRFLAGAAAICGVRSTLCGDAPGPHTLLLSNHLSWLDILVLGGRTGCAFVSKDNLGHGFIHWLADQNHTVYVRREDKRAGRAQALALVRALEGPHPVALFPEGTTGPGDRLLPFRSPLLAALNDTDRSIAVRPVAIDYGDHMTDIAWHGESARANVARVLGRRGGIGATVHLLDPIQPADRKTMAATAHRAIASRLALDSSAAPLYARTDDQS